MVLQFENSYIRWIWYNLDEHRLYHVCRICRFWLTIKVRFPWERTNENVSKGAKIVVRAWQTLIWCYKMRHKFPNYKLLQFQGFIRQRSKAVLINTSAGVKYIYTVLRMLWFCYKRYGKHANCNLDLEDYREISGTLCEIELFFGCRMSVTCNSIPDPQQLPLAVQERAS